MNLRTVRRTLGTCAAALTLAALTPGTSSAGILFFEGSFGGPEIEMANQQDVSTVFAYTAQVVDAHQIEIQIEGAPGQLLDANQNNLITPAGGSELTFLRSRFESDYGAQVFEFSVLPDAAGVLTIAATDQFGSVIPDGIFNLSQGLTKFYALADGGSLITSLTLSSTVDLKQVKQIAVDGVARVRPGPEPGTLGLGLAGALGAVGMARRRRLARA